MQCKSGSAASRLSYSFNIDAQYITSEKKIRVASRNERIYRYRIGKLHNLLSLGIFMKKKTCIRKNDPKWKIVKFFNPHGFQLFRVMLLKFFNPHGFLLFRVILFSFSVYIVKFFNPHGFLLFPGYIVKFFNPHGFLLFPVILLSFSIRMVFNCSELYC